MLIIFHFHYFAMNIPNKLKITYNAELPNGKRFSESTESNAVNTEILSYSVSKILSSDRTSAREGQRVHNTVTVINNSATKLFNNFFTIPQPNGASFADGSVKINGISQPSYDPVKGFSIPDLAPYETVIIEYEITANKPKIITDISQFATLNYSLNDPARETVDYTENTNTVFIGVTADKDTEQLPIQPPSFISQRIYKIYTGSPLTERNDCCYCGCCGCDDF